MDSDLEVNRHIITWSIMDGDNHPLHQQPIDEDAKLSDSAKLTIPLEELKMIFVDWKANKGERERRATLADPSSKEKASFSSVL